MKRVGIIGGTFNPIHKAHLNIALEAYKQYDLDEVWFMPAGNPPHKMIWDNISPKDRMEMVSLAIKDFSQFKLCEIEINKTEPCYTWKTLKELHKKYGESIAFFFIIGADSFYQFSNWVKPEKICKYAEILVAGRPEENTEYDFKEKKKEYQQRYGNHFSEIKVDMMHISSTEIREKLELGEDVESVIPSEVLSYIRQKNLYLNRYAPQRLLTIQKEVQNELKPERFEHTLGVMYTAGNLAYRYHISSGKALVAGLLHDCAKCLSDERRLDICREQNIPMSDIEKKNPHLLHGKVGAYLAKEKYGISDDDVLHSIAVHTTGCVDMSILDKIIYVADYIEPHRDKAPRLPEIREMAYINLDQCVYMILEDTVNYLGNNPENLDETTVKTFEYYKNILKKGN